MSKRFERYDQIIRDYFLARMDENVLRAKRFAYADLQFGPAHNDLSEEDCKGLTFESACQILCDWWQEQPHQIWLDEQSEEVCESQPEGYTDEETKEYVPPGDSYVWDFTDIKRAVFGKELSQYIR